MEKIRTYANRIAVAFEPERIILFGSYACGNPTEDSDVDLLVIVPGNEFANRQSLEIRRALNPGFALDILVRSSGQLEERIAMNDFFLQDIVEKGKVLYEADHARVG